MESTLDTGEYSAHQLSYRKNEILLAKVFKGMLFICGVLSFALWTYLWFSQTKDSMLLVIGLYIFGAIILTVNFCVLVFLIRKNHVLMYRKTKWSLFLYYIGTLSQCFIYIFIYAIMISYFQINSDTGIVRLFYSVNAVEEYAHCKMEINFD